ncbi:MAG: hydantoinase/oxoprolinase family protein, partial [Pseudorhodoplanes sp.]
DAQVDSVAISFLNSYRNPLHELQAQQMLRELLPGVFVTLGTELSRELMEYERTATVAANAFVGSRMASYIAAFQQELDARSFHGRFYLMGSNGGAMSADAALANPVALIESGPVGGCAGAAVYASEMSIDRMIAFDMGGTTAKCALIESGTFEVVNTYYVNGYERGFPIRTPVLDIVEVGAGGGSLAWLDEHGRMRLGPRSAGSEPGPIAFGRGGVEPTLTDANVVLGRIGSDSFMDGALRLDIDAASEGIRLSLAEPLGFVGEDGVDRVAQGALDLACVAMSNAIKAITIERGRDVRGYTLFAFGGGGPIFATEIARSLGIGKVVVPPHPGMFSSFGMLLAPLRRDVAKAFMQPMNQDSLIAAEAQFAELEREVRESMSADVDVASIVCRREADISYMGQSHSVKVRLPAALTLESCSEAFEEAYRARYGHLNKDSRLHISVLRVVCEAELLKPDLRTLAAPRSGTEPGYGSDASDRHEDGAGAISPAQSREVYFAALRGRVRTPVYRRRDLSCGWHIEGPAIIEEYSSTTILGPGDLLEVGVLGELTIHCGTLPTGGRAAEGLSAAEACLGRHGSSENRA